jgi:hypothetical protein
MERKPLLAGSAVGTAASIKYLSLIFVPYFLIKRNFRAAIASVFAFIFFVALPAAEFGLGRGENLCDSRAARSGLNDWHHGDS